MRSSPQRRHPITACTCATAFPVPDEPSPIPIVSLARGFSILFWDMAVQRISTGIACCNIDSGLVLVWYLVTKYNF